MTTTINGSSPSITFSDGSAQTSATRPFQNRIINGAMVIDQRNAGASVTVNGNSPFITDRFRCDDDTDGAYTAQQVSTAPAGFNNSVQVTVTTADTSLSASQYALFYHSIEGFNVADLNWGTANAKTVTLSFWVRSSLTGTFSGSLENNANNRSYIFTYSISVANTFEYKTITIAGDTSGTWETGTAVGIRINWNLGAGSSFLGTAGAWGNRFFGSTGSVALIGTNSATWFITGIQLEVGSTATSFDYRPYGTELALCQRYFQLFGSLSTPATNIMLGGGMATSSTGGMAVIALPQEMRTTPSLTFSSTASAFKVVSSNDSSITCNAVPTANVLGNKAIRVSFGVASGITAGNATILFGDTSNAAWIGASSEL